jgi:hypothetical protein
LPTGFGVDNLEATAGAAGALQLTQYFFSF